MCKGREFRGCFEGVGGGSLSVWGMELVPYSGVDEVEVGVGGGVFEEDSFKHLGWVQELVDDRLALSTPVLNPLAIREPMD